MSTPRDDAERTPPTAASGWPDIIFTDGANRASLSAAAKRGTLGRLAPGIYTGRVRAAPEEVVAREWLRILAHELPGAVIADRSARTGGPERGALYVVHSRQRPLRLPGLTIVPRNGPGVLPGDTEIAQGVWLSSQPRGLIDNAAGRGERYLTSVELEHWLADLLLVHGEARLNSLRDQARELATSRLKIAAARRLDAMIGAALATRPARALGSDALRARAAGHAYDHGRLAAFETFVRILEQLPPDPHPALPQDAARRELLPFYEAYFSNYIEGTEFTLAEAARIVFEQEIPPNRPQDAHDIIGTYRIVADAPEMARTPSHPDTFIRLLTDRHRTMLAARPDVHPGQFKVVANRAGSSVFVDPDLVEETLRVGLSAGSTLIGPFARAAYLMFLLTEVHPFDGGNGRIARVMMNAELERGREVRIIIPTVFRNNYLAALKGATHNSAFESLVDVLRFAQRYTARIDFSTRQTAERDLARTNATRDADEAEQAGVRLTLP